MTTDVTPRAVEKNGATRLERAPGPTEVTAPDDKIREQLLADPRVQTLLADVTGKLDGYSKQYADKYRMLTERATAQRSGKAEIAEPITPFPVPYLWFDLMVAGPFQAVQPNGPFLPHRIIQTGEQAFLLAVLWRNPVSLLGGPSAAQIMAPYQYVVRGHSIDINTVTAAPPMAPVSAVFGAGNVNLAVLPISSVPAPPQGDPRLLEIHVTVDMVGPGPGLPPFAGFATRWFQPDLQPGFLGLPDILPGFLDETPVRVLVYS